MRQISREWPEAHRGGAINIDGVADVAPRMKRVRDGGLPGPGFDGAADRPIEKIARWDLDAGGAEEPFNRRGVTP